MIPAYPGCVVPLEIFMVRKFDMGFFGGLSFGPGILLGLFEALGIFFGLDFWPVTWNLEYPPPSPRLGAWRESPALPYPCDHTFPDSRGLFSLLFGGRENRLLFLPAVEHRGKRLVDKSLAFANLMYGNEGNEKNITIDIKKISRLFHFSTMLVIKPANFD